VIGMPDPEWGELVTAVIVPADPGAPPDLGQLRSRARERGLPGYATPRRLVLADRIELLASGKPDRQALRAGVISRSNQQSDRRDDERSSHAACRARPGDARK
jgi:acyl-CoA synthetase (AMP-forming)/AMP-acid ligase II